MRAPLAAGGFLRVVRSVGSPHFASKLIDQLSVVTLRCFNGYGRDQSQGEVKTVPRKMRQLRADLKRAGFVELQGRGKGDHTAHRHPLVEHTYIMDGANGDDAKPYQEKDVRAALTQLADAKRKEERT